MKETLEAPIFPTGFVRDELTFWGDGLASYKVQAILMDADVPTVLVQACDFGITGHEAVEVLAANSILRKKLDNLGIAAGKAMRLDHLPVKKDIQIILLSLPTAAGSMLSCSYISPFFKVTGLPAAGGRPVEDQIAGNPQHGDAEQAVLKAQKP